MDWEHTVSRLANVQPALVVDRARRVRFVNGAMQDLLGWRTDELLGRRWLGTAVVARDRALVQRIVSEGLSGSAQSGELPFVNRTGQRLVVRAHLVRESVGRAHVLVVVAGDVRQVTTPSLPTWDWSCDVSRAPEKRGIVQSMRFLDPSRDASPYIGQPVGALLSDFGCIAVDRAVDALLDPQLSERVHIVVPDVDHVFCVISARALDDGDVRLTVRYVDVQLLPAFVEAKVQRVAETSGLSDRERQVLELLLRGRGLEDIASTLDIAPRTVKFHQANVLQKLGAESRLDLLRVVL